VLILIHVGNINCLGEADNYNYVDNAFILLLKILERKKKEFIALLAFSLDSFKG